MRAPYLTATAALALCLVGLARTASPQQAQPKTFSSPGEAARALVQAVRDHDESAIQAILGAGREVTSSGDESLDTLEREQFARKFEEMHRLVKEPDGTTVLYIGAENWPFPIPLTSTNGKWFFDALPGSREVLFRRIGENEERALGACRTRVDVKDAALETPGYQFRTVSDPAGKAVGTTGTRAGRGKMITGIAFAAYWSEYRTTGVMTFIVTNDGTVYERTSAPTRPRGIHERRLPAPPQLVHFVPSRVTTARV